MGYDYKTILSIQEIDVALISLRREMESIPAGIEELRRSIAREKSESEKSKQGVKELTLKRRDMEKEVESKNEHIRKLKGQRGLVKTNEEYRALEKEISHDQGTVSKMEDQILDFLEKIENSEKDVRDKDAAFQNKEQEIRQKIAQAEARLKNLEEQVKAREFDKSRLVRDVTPTLLRLYEKILENKKDTAIVPVLDDKVCGGCRMALTANVRNEARKNKIVQCDNCSRIIYVP
jgi:hypothetical protein